MDKESFDDLRQKLNLETARIRWDELHPHYARGVLITVAEGLDLVEIAASMAADDTARIQDWLQQDRIRRTSAEDAERWDAEDIPLWAVVVAPWVLVQEVPDPA